MSTRTPRTEHQGAPPERLPDPAAVRAFLEANPDFLAEHPQLFEKLVPPAAHAEANVHDLRQFNHVSLVTSLQLHSFCAIQCHSFLFLFTHISFGHLRLSHVTLRYIT